LLLEGGELNLRVQCQRAIGCDICHRDDAIVLGEVKSYHPLHSDFEGLTSLEVDVQGFSAFPGPAALCVNLLQGPLSIERYLNAATNS
jgi:hypothetical protein